MATTITTDKDSYNKDDPVYAEFKVLSMEPDGIVLVHVYSNFSSVPLVTEKVEVDSTTLIGKWTIPKETFNQGTVYFILALHPPGVSSSKKIEHAQYP